MGGDTGLDRRGKFGYNFSRYLSTERYMAKPTPGDPSEARRDAMTDSAYEAAVAADRAEEDVAKHEVKSRGLGGKEAEVFLLGRWVDRCVPFAKALADATRLKIVGILALREPMEVGVLAKELKVRSSTMSQHLALLRDARIVRMEKHGIRTQCSLNRRFIEWRLGQIAEKMS